jgi:hypothetical protein
MINSKACIEIKSRLCLDRPRIGLSGDAQKWRQACLRQARAVTTRQMKTPNRRSHASRRQLQFQIEAERNQCNLYREFDEI